jgi:hypothetical protein
MTVKPFVRADAAPRVRSDVLWCRMPATDDAVVANRHFAVPPVVRPATADDVALLSYCDGHHTLAAMAEASRAPVAHVVDAIERWEAIAPGMFVWPETAAADSRLHHRLRQAHRIHRQWRAATEPQSDNDTYHRRGIANAVDQFDRLETTVSHAFRDPHRALGGRTYGEAFCDTLLEHGALRPGARVLEIGGGVGFFAAAFLRRLRQREPAIYETVRYTVLDLSATLQESQRSLCRAHQRRMTFMLGDVETLQLPAACADVVIANEMIADLSIGRADTTRLAGNGPRNEAESLVQQYRLDWTTALPQCAVNVGAIRLVEHLGSWLAPDATAVMTEYGSVTQLAAVVPLDGHNEYSIHFGHLAQVATALEMDARTENLGDFLGADGDCQVVRRTSLQMLRYHLLPHLRAADLPARTYDAAALQAQLGEWGSRIGNIQTGRLRDDGWMTPFGFHALTLRNVRVARPRLSAPAFA